MRRVAVFVFSIWTYDLLGSNFLFTGDSGRSKATTSDLRRFSCVASGCAAGALGGRKVARYPLSCGEEE